jgi:hypothetical protein
MSQHDMDVANGAGVVVRADINAALQALASLSSGSSAPSPSFPCQLWADTGTSRLKRRNAANSAWVDEGPLDAALRDAASQGMFVADTGAANAYVCNFVPTITARSESTPLRFKVANANSGASTINDGVGTVALVGATQAALVGGEMIANGIAWIQWNATTGSYVLLFCTGAAGPAVNQVQTAFTTAGTAPAFTLTPVPALGGYAANQRYRVKFNAAAAASGTLNVSGLGAKNLKQYSSSGAKVSANIAANQLTDVEYDGTDFVVLDPIQGSVFNEAPPVTLASAATVNIGAAAANTINISGTTTITAFDTIASGWRRLVFQGALTLTHNATAMILPGGANILVGSGDTADFVSLGSGNWACVSYQKNTTPTGIEPRLILRFDGTATPPTIQGQSGSVSVTSITRVSAGSFDINLNAAIVSNIVNLVIVPMFAVLSGQIYVGIIDLANSTTTKLRFITFLYSGGVNTNVAPTALIVYGAP